MMLIDKLLGSLFQLRDLRLVVDDLLVFFMFHVPKSLARYICVVLCLLFT